MRNGRPHLVWPVAKIACSSTKQGSIYIPKGIMDVLEEAHRRKAPSLLQKGVTITILGAISDARVIDISLRKPQAVSTSKKRKVDGKAVDAVNGRIGTRTEHFLAYLSNVMDVLDKSKMQGYYLVMDNAPIHTPAKVRNPVEGRHYRYLPPYSPFLNPIEEF